MRGTFRNAVHYFIFSIALNFVLTILTANFVTAGVFNNTGNAGKRVLVIVIDGLRPDYVTDETMPVLAHIRRTGYEGQNHHAVYPTSTRINSASIATGSYPQKHGLLNNALYMPRVDSKQKLDTGTLADLLRIENQAGGSLLTTATLGDILAQHRKKLLFPVPDLPARPICSLSEKGTAHWCTANWSFRIPLLLRWRHCSVPHQGQRIILIQTASAGPWMRC